MSVDTNTRHVLEAVLVNLSFLHHARLNDDEKRASHENMEDLIQQMDAARVPYAVQNSLFYIARKWDVRSCYLADMLRAAFDRVGAVCPF